MSIMSEERWAEHEEYVKNSWPKRTSDRKHFGHMIPERPKKEDYHTPCCGSLYSYSTSGCYACAICYECGNFLGCQNLVGMTECL